jgi:large subunit ribosomal protein L9
MAHAEIILTENIPNLGAEADLVKVRSGYARNFLIPRGKAVEATGASVRMINHLKAKRAEREALEVTAAEDLARRIGKLNLQFELETGQGGKAFGSVTARDITEKLLAELKDVELPKHAVVLEKAIKESGEHSVEVKVHADVMAKVRLTIAAPVKAVVADERPARPARRRAESAPTESTEA